MKKIDIITIGAILLVLIGLVVGTSSYYSYRFNECIADPVAYANNHSDNYYWDSVLPIRYDDYSWLN